MGKQKNKKSSRNKIEETEKDLDRFAGSSEEEADDSSDGNSDVSDVEETVKKPKNDKGPENASDSSHYDVSISDELELSKQDDEDEALFGSGMANAMSRILGTTSKAGSASVILSKTTTPLQRMALKEKQYEKELRDKQRAKRERNLAALHVPLSVATTSTNAAGASESVGKELEQERTHRRVATRGVVALFNAIAQHQKKNEIKESIPSTKSKEEVKKMSKHGFLDMIKTAAAAKTKEEEPKQIKDSVEPSKWNALQDDYMLNSKLKDWDKESSEEENDVNEDWSDEEGNPASKKRRVNAQ